LSVMGLGAICPGPFAGWAADCSDMTKPFETGAAEAIYLAGAVARGRRGGKPALITCPQPRRVQKTADD